jgi:hypothetical protein
MAIQRMSDKIYVAKYHFSSPAVSTTFDVCLIPRYGLVLGVWFHVTTADADATVVIGFKGNGTTAVTNHFMTDTESAIATAGMKNGMVAAKQGYYFGTAGGAVTMTTDATANTGVGDVFVLYTIVR